MSTVGRYSQGNRPGYFCVRSFFPSASRERGSMVAGHNKLHESTKVNFKREVVQEDMPVNFGEGRRTYGWPNAAGSGRYCRREEDPIRCAITNRVGARQAEGGGEKYTRRRCWWGNQETSSRNGMIHLNQMAERSKHWRWLMAGELTARRGI